MSASEKEENLVVDFGDGVSALDRAMRGIVFIVDGAISRLVGLGFERDRDRINIITHDDGLPTWVECRGKRLFEVDLRINGDGSIAIEGRWLEEPRRKGFWARLFGF